MKPNRSLLLLLASAGIAGCGDQASKLLAPTSAAETGSSSGGGSGDGFTWTIKKELVEVHLTTPAGEMILDPVSPYSIKLGETKWFTFRITYTRTNGGNMGPTAVISDDVAAACATLGPGYKCTSADADFGLPGTITGEIGVKTWTVSSSGKIEGILDIENKNAGCPSSRMLKNTAVLTSNGKVRSSDEKVPINSPNCDQKEKGKKEKEKKHCNQGVGNGPEGCDPGNSNHNQPSNDENGGTPGNPGRKGGR
jgi:hypothetical protein